MKRVQFNWKRFWSPREGVFDLSDNGFLVDPEGKYGRYYTQDVFSYEQISEKTCLVLLGEPGIGKTMTMRDVEEIEKNNQITLRIDLGMYGSEDRLINDLRNHPIIKEWLQGNYRLTLLLDSLDECLIRVTTIAKLLGYEFSNMPVDRLCLRIACRTLVWPISLEEYLISLWGKENVDVYELLPLRKKDVTEATKQLSLSADAFLEEVSRVRAQPLAIKPVALKFLLNEFERENKLPGREAELYLRGCLHLCEESQERIESNVPSVCDATQRFKIAQRIAYVTIFSGKISIWKGVHDGSMPVEDIPISDLLGMESLEDEDFQINDAAVLDALNTGLFSSRGTNRMGWAHQTYAEFLAAHYVQVQLDVRQIKSLLLFSDSEGKTVVPQLSEVAARIASFNKDLFEEILMTSPNVLLRSDVSTADYEQRYSLIDSILRKCETDELDFRDVDQEDRLRHLNHPLILDQLRPFVIDDTFNLYSRYFALALINACAVDGLQIELLDLVLNTNAAHGLRWRAMDIIGKNINEEIAMKLRPLIMDRPEGSDYSIKGQVLKALWPEYLTAEEIFDTLTPKRDENNIDSYDWFISDEFPKGLSSIDIPTALEWVQKQGSRHELDYNSKALLDGILIAAWNHLDENGILSVFTDVLWHRLMIDYGNIIEGSIDEKSKIFNEERKRRVLLTEMVSKINIIKNRDEGIFYLGGHGANIVRPTDFPWLVEITVQKSNETEAEAWAKLCYWNYNINIVEQTYLLTESCAKSNVLNKQFEYWLKPVVLDSPEAKKLKENYYKFSGYGKRDNEPPLLDPPPKERIKNILDRCEAGEPCLWSWIAKDLELEPRSTHYKFPSEPDITTLPGWKEAEKYTKTRIHRAAKLYIEECNDRRDEWVHDEHKVLYPAYAGYQALRLIHTSDPKYITELSSDVWSRWAVALIHHPFNLRMEEAENFHKPFMEQLFKRIPTEGTEALRLLIERVVGGTGSLSVLDRVDHVQCKNFSIMLKSLIDQKIFTLEGVARVLTIIVTRTDNKIPEWILSLIRSPVPMEQKERDYALGAAIALCSPATKDNWPKVWSAICDDVDFGKQLIELLAFRTRTNKYSFNGLSDEQIEDLYIWVSREFPHIEDPEIGSVNVNNVRREIADWRDNYLLQILKNRGSVSACQSIKKIMEKLPHLSWLRFTWLNALKIMRTKTWRPLLPSSLLQLTQSKKARVVSSGHDLVQVLLESLDRLKIELHGEIPMARYLWDLQRDSKQWRPVDEDALSDFIANYLNRDIRDRGIIVNREVQIRPKIEGSGQETDIHVDAVIRSEGGSEFDIVQCIIETKGCWHQELNNAMQTQLVDRYLRDNQCQNGIYLIGYFMCDAWDNNDYRKGKCSKKGIEKMHEYFDAQAESLSKDGLTIRARVLDVRL